VTPPCRLIRQHEAVGTLRKHDVGDDQIDSVVGVEYAPCRFTVARDGGVISLIHEDALEEISNFLIVLDDEHLANLVHTIGPCPKGANAMVKLLLPLLVKKGIA
jgi:hypothetical protein